MRVMTITRAMTAGLLLAGLTAGCVPAMQSADYAPRAANTVMSTAERAAFERDRAAILAMAGEYQVAFSFRETVPLHDGYKLKDEKLSGGNEVVRVIADDGDFISLQHILLVGPDSDVVVKHWRQDWIYEPTEVWDFVGRNTWTIRPLSRGERAGKWAQLVYQVDDGPRYAGVAEWVHENGTSSWTSPASWRPLPRRDATTRDDYDVIVAVNRHALTPDGWVHEQDNSKLVLDDEPHYLVREVGVNTYNRADNYDPAPADDYWEATAAFWEAIRAEWARIARENRQFGLTVEGEPEPVYLPILALATEVENGDKAAGSAAGEAIEILRSFLVTEPRTP